MEIKTFRAKTMPQALALVRRELGPEAMVLHTRELNGGLLGRMLLGRQYEIAATPGIDMLYFGPADFAHGLGVPGKLDDPRVQEARRRVVDVCKRHGKLAGTVCFGGAHIRELLDMGYLFLNLGADVLGLWEYWRRVVADIGEHAKWWMAELAEPL